ncbi:MAG: phosphatase PAP2 family protein [Syntrophomonadaceae bacterium]|nr:phosphatase PAP2 family protein [Syntrophomonadaceae bacterium]
MSLLKDFFGRPRPSGEHLTIATGMSFPSGHAMLSMAFYGFVAYLLAQRVNSPQRRKLIWAVAVIFIFLIGFSRLYLNVHYPTDVIAGFLLGALFLFAFIKLYQRHRSHI